jgi:predicted GNAT family acetyltransferase
MKLQQKSKTEYIFLDNDIESAIGYIYEFEASKIHINNRINYFIEFDFKDVNEQQKKDMVHMIVEVAQEMRQKNYPDFNARVYHCCFSDNHKMINFFKSVEGFNDDEAMIILEKKTSMITNQLKMDYICKENNLSDDDLINTFIKEQSKIFGDSYSLEKTKEMLSNNMASIGIYDSDQLIANILLIKEENNGWIEDLFVHENYRKKGLAAFLLEQSHNYFYTQSIDTIQLEVWKSNERAVNLYHKMGYKYLKTTEVSIGKTI